MKNIFNLFITFIILTFININHVFAENNPSCQYINTDGSGENITAVIYLSTEGISSYSTINTRKYGSIITHNGYNNVMVGLEWPFINEDFETAIDYWKGTEKQKYQDANKRCPDYFYVCNTSDGVIGLFSDKAPSVFKVGVCDEIFKSDAVEVTKKQNGELEQTEERYSCTLASPLINDFSLNLQINYTKKEISFSTSKGIEETNYVKNFNYENKNEPPSDLKVCYNIFEKSNSINFSNYYVYPRSDNSFQDKYSDSVICHDLIESSSNKVGTKFCDVFQNKVDMYMAEINSGNTAKKYLNQLKIYCKSILSNANYDNYEYSCINLCLNINNYIPDITLKEGECGFSQKLTLFIANIIKWVKYLIPVVAIVLSILEFIKAVGADKDDEMKKAQGNFVKRMIAAALIFIVPVIIEFVLDAMGFNVNGCGIIDL